MKKDDHIKLGFSSHAELVTYYDVCIDLCRYDYNEENDSIKGFFTKDECIETINKYNLMDLYNKVKDLYTYDRLVEIFLYFFNTLEVYNFGFEVFNEKLSDVLDSRNANIIFYYCDKLMQINDQMDKFVYCLKETSKKISRRFDLEELLRFNDFLDELGFMDGDDKKL